jgi:pyruvate/2-oxoglutarate dehydrogenase complex dihydrolipoamide dehydrogenase (E3) component
LVIIGGGVAGYVAAIKAGQEGMKVRDPYFFSAITPDGGG